MRLEMVIYIIVGGRTFEEYVE